jgi:ribonuclease BN (tRNA processing enzyme)
MSGAVLFLGTGDAFGSGGRLHTATLIRTATARVLVDCGPSTLTAFRRERIEPGDVDIILLTHLHGDHFGGLPFYLMDAHYASRRTRPLVIAGPAGMAERTAQAQELFFPGNGRLPLRFPLTWAEWDEGRRMTLGTVAVTPLAVSHSDETPCFGLRVECGDRVIAFSGDTEWTPSLIDLACDADLFVCECFGYDTAPPGHLDYVTLMRQRSSLTCRRLVLTHMGDGMLRRARSVGVPTASDGLLMFV